MTAQYVTLGRAFLFSWRRLRRRVSTRAQLTIVYGILAAIAATTALVAVNLAVRLVPDPLLTGGTGRLLDALMIVSVVALITLIAGTTLVTWMITGGVLRPLNELNAAATRAAQGPPAGGSRSANRRRSPAATSSPRWRPASTGCWPGWTTSWRRAAGSRRSPRPSCRTS